MDIKSCKIKDVDIIFLSYDEPNAEENWADLQRKIPWAKRVHGVEGSDAAHKACADLSDTKHFVTVDGDTIVDPKFMHVVLDYEKLGVDDDYQFSWCGKVNANGLMYGNGSLKMWTKDFVKNMKTHENTDGSDDTQIEFCYFDNYYQLNENYSEFFQYYSELIKKEECATVFTNEAAIFYFIKKQSCSKYYFPAEINNYKWKKGCTGFKDWKKRI